jgi:transglutaminase-like putative cysteine protease
MQVTVEHRSDTILSGKLPWLRLLPEDGWLTLGLLVVVVYTTIASIQAVTPPWAPGLSILTLTTGMGLLLGYIVVQQGRLPGTLVHSVALILGIVFAFQQTANATLNGDRKALLQHMRFWFQHSVLNHDTSSDNTVFLLFLAVLSFLLAYISIWLVLHSRRPWLAALANGVVLLINLNWATQDKAVFFIILFLLATLLLLVRFTLAENVRQWRARGLRFSPDLGWDFMQAGAIFAVVVLTLANILPAGAGNTSILSAWNSSKNPWQSIQTTFQTLFNGVQGGRGGGGGSGFNFFGSELTLGNSPNLPTVPILHYSLPNAGNDPGQYLITQTLDQYEVDTAAWSPSISSPVGNLADQPLPGSVNPSYFKVNAYDITLDQPLADSPLFAPGSSAQSFSVASQTYISQPAGVPVKWSSANDQRAGTKYSAVAYVSTATKAELQQVQYPSQITDPNKHAQQYPLGILAEYLPPGSLPSIVVQDAHSWTSGALNMYDAATDIENYLHSQFRYSLHVNPPSGQNPLDWFLSHQVGFCTYFATAMVLMARDLGMPSRIAMGFASGQYDSKTGTWVVPGTQAHVWPQIYFGSQYGWINFEPTSSFLAFNRGTGSGAGGGTTPQSPGATSTPGRTLPNLGKTTHPNGSPGGNNTPGHVNPVIVDAGLGFTLAILLSLLGLVLLTSWWRLLYRGLSPIVASFARIARLGAWAGVVPKRSQTPDEYVEQLGSLIPGQRPALERLSYLYARERWGGGLPEEIAGEEVPRLYTEVRQSITHQIADRLRMVPVKTFTSLRRLLMGKDGYNGAEELHKRRE